MKRFLAIAGLVFVAGSSAQAQVIWDSGNGPGGTSRPANGTYAGQAFTFSVSQLLTQFGFYGQTNGGIFKFFIADAANTVIRSDVVTLAASPNPTLLLSDVFTQALGPGTYSSVSSGRTMRSSSRMSFFPRST